MRTKDDFSFLKLFGKINDDFISEAAPKQTYSSRVIPLKKIAAAAVVVLLLSTVLFSSETVIAGFRNLTSVIRDILGFSEKADDYTEVIGKTITQNGISITLQEVILDENKMYVSYEIRADEPEKQDCLMVGDTWINGHKLTGSNEFSEVHDDMSAPVRKITAYHFNPEYITDGQAKIKILLRPAELDSMKEYGEFLYEFEASADKLKNNTLTLDLNWEIPVEEDSILQLKSFSLNSVGSDVTGVWENYPGEYGKYHIEYFLRGEDNLGNTVKYRQRRYEKPNVYFTLHPSEGMISPRAESLTLQLYACFWPPSGHDIVEYYEPAPGDTDQTAEIQGDFKLDDYTQFTDDPLKPFAIGDKIKISVCERE